MLIYNSQQFIYTILLSLLAKTHSSISSLLTLWPPSYSIRVFTHLKLHLTDAIHNFKWLKIILISQNLDQLFSNIVDCCHVLRFWKVLLDVLIRTKKKQIWSGLDVEGINLVSTVRNNCKSRDKYIAPVSMSLISVIPFAHSATRQTNLSRDYSQ